MGSRLGLCVIEDTIYTIDVTDLPIKRSFTRSVAALDGKIYIMGGTNNINWDDDDIDNCYYDNMESDYENYLNSVDCFDTVTNTWISVAHLNHARLSPGLVVINGSLIAVGWDKDRTIEEYNVINNTWTVREET